MGEYYQRKGPEGAHQFAGELDFDHVEGHEDLRAVQAVLARPRRRVILDVVTEHGPVTTRDLAIQIAARVDDVASSAVADDQLKPIAVSLHHVDVPKLVAAAVLTTDDGVDRIRAGPKASLVDRVLDATASEFGGRDTPTSKESG